VIEKRRVKAKAERKKKLKSRKNKSRKSDENMESEISKLKQFSEQI
jgi:hypothetical protein